MCVVGGVRCVLCVKEKDVKERGLRSVQRVSQDVNTRALTPPAALASHTRLHMHPQVVTMALRTTSLVVRTAALAMLSGVVHRLDRDAADKMMDVCAQVCIYDFCGVRCCAR